MFTWFRKGAEYLHYEAQMIDQAHYELTIYRMDGTDTVERFTDEGSLQTRQVQLQEELESYGWTGPHGWNM